MGLTNYMLEWTWGIDGRFMQDPGHLQYEPHHVNALSQRLGKTINHLVATYEIDGSLKETYPIKCMGKLHRSNGLTMCGHGNWQPTPFVETTKSTECIGVP